MRKLRTETVRPAAPMDKTARCGRRVRAVRQTAVLKGQTAAASGQPEADRAEADRAEATAVPEAMAAQAEVKAADKA